MKSVGSSWHEGMSVYEGIPPLPTKRERRRAAEKALAEPDAAPKPSVEVRRKAAELLHERRGGSRKTPGLHILASALDTDVGATEKLRKLLGRMPSSQELAEYKVKERRAMEGALAVTRKEARALRAEPAEPKELLRTQMGVLRPDACRSQPLHTAVASNNVRAVRALLTAGADARVCNIYRSTPLHLAASNGRAKVAVLLLEAGAELEAKTVGGKTPKDYAQERVPFTSVASAAEMLMLLRCAARAEQDRLSRAAVVASAAAAGAAAVAAVENAREPQDALAATSGRLPKEVVDAAELAGAAAAAAIGLGHGRHEAAAAGQSAGQFLSLGGPRDQALEVGEAAARRVRRHGEAAARAAEPFGPLKEPAAREAALRAAAAALANGHSKAEVAEAAKAAGSFAAQSPLTVEAAIKAAKEGATAARRLQRAQEALRALSARGAVVVRFRTLKFALRVPKTTQESPQKPVAAPSSSLDVERLAALEEQAQGAKRAQLEAQRLLETREAEHAKALEESRGAAARSRQQVSELELQLQKARAEAEQLRRERGVDDDFDAYDLGD